VPTAHAERRLAAILASDVVGYSSLMERDEDRTLARLKAHRREFIEPLIAEYQGRVVKLMGDGALVEFASVVDAVRCAVLIQQGMAEREATVPEAERIRFRIGINLGDVIREADGDLYGDGVNVAARLEQLAKPGGVVVSGTAYDQLQGKLDLPLEFAGEQRIKNIERLVRAYHVQLDGRAPRLGSPWTPRLNRRVVMTVFILLLLITAAAGGWWWRHPNEPARTPLPDKPSVAVLPFKNLSADPRQEYFSDGITEDLITALSRFPELLVIARNSTFSYKGQAIDVRLVGETLDARYVVEGGVQADAGRVRVTAQLIDTPSGLARWADSFDRELTDIFAVQDEITQRITGALVTQVSRAELERSTQKPPARWEAYDHLLQANAAEQLRRVNRSGETLAEVRRLLEQSLAADPAYARAWAALADNYLNAWIEPYDLPPFKEEYQQPATLDHALTLARKAVELDDGSAEAHAELGSVLNWAHRHDDAVAEFRRAFELNPNLAAADYGDVLVYAGHAAEAIEVIKRTMRLDPLFSPLVLAFLGHAYYTAGQYGPAIEQLTSCSRRAPKFRPCHVWAAAAYAQAGQATEARVEARRVLELQPGFTIGKWMGFVSYKDPANAAHLVEGLRQAGLPE